MNNDRYSTYGRYVIILYDVILQTRNFTGKKWNMYLIVFLAYLYTIGCGYIWRLTFLHVLKQEAVSGLEWCAMRGACVQRLTEIDDDDGFTCPLNYCYKFKTIMYVVRFFLYHSVGKWCWVFRNIKYPK